MNRELNAEFYLDRLVPLVKKHEVCRKTKLKVRDKWENLSNDLHSAEDMKPYKKIPISTLREVLRNLQEEVLIKLENNADLSHPAELIILELLGETDDSNESSDNTQVRKASLRKQQNSASIEQEEPSSSSSSSASPSSSSARQQQACSRSDGLQTFSLTDDAMLSIALPLFVKHNVTSWTKAGKWEAVLAELFAMEDMQGFRPIGVSRFVHLLSDVKRAVKLKARNGGQLSANEQAIWDLFCCKKASKSQTNDAEEEACSAAAAIATELPSARKTQKTTKRNLSPPKHPQPSASSKRVRFAEPTSEEEDENDEESHEAIAKAHAAHLPRAASSDPLLCQSCSATSMSSDLNVLKLQLKNRTMAVRLQEAANAGKTIDLEIMGVEAGKLRSQIELARLERNME